MCSKLDNHNSVKHSLVQSVWVMQASCCLNKSLGSSNVDLSHAWFRLLQNATALWSIRTMCVEGRSERSIHPHAQREAETRLVADCHLLDKEHTEILTGCEGCTEHPGWTNAHYLHRLTSETACLNQLHEAQFEVHGSRQAPLGRS